MKTPLQRARERANVSQTVVGDAIGLSQARVSDFERLKDGVPVARPDPDTAEAIVNFFRGHGISLNEMRVMYPERYIRLPRTA